MTHSAGGGGGGGVEPLTVMGSGSESMQAEGGEDSSCSTPSISPLTLPAGTRVCCYGVTRACCYGVTRVCCYGITRACCHGLTREVDFEFKVLPLGLRGFGRWLSLVTSTLC